MSTVVRITGIITIDPGIAILFFCGVVLITMLAADEFDERLIWDNLRLCAKSRHKARRKPQAPTAAPAPASGRAAAAAAPSARVADSRVGAPAPAPDAAAPAPAPDAAASAAGAAPAECAAASLVRTYQRFQALAN